MLRICVVKGWIVLVVDRESQGQFAALCTYEYRKDIENENILD
jgi:hypothetical protein